MIHFYFSEKIKIVMLKLSFLVVVNHTTVITIAIFLTAVFSEKPTLSEEGMRSTL